MSRDGWCRNPTTALGATAATRGSDKVADLRQGRRAPERQGVDRTLVYRYGYYAVAGGASSQSDRQEQ